VSGCGARRHVTRTGNALVRCSSHEREYQRAKWLERKAQQPAKPHVPLALRPCRVAGCAESRRVDSNGRVDARCAGHALKLSGSSIYRDYYFSIRGMTREQYDALVFQQGGHCAICGTDDPGTSGVDGMWCVDHDHRCCPGQATPRKPWCGRCVRGLLCRDCNFGIASLRDSPEIARAAARYLEFHGTQLPLELVS
jgi:hypothetical protein